MNMPMDIPQVFYAVCAIAPLLLMATVVFIAMAGQTPIRLLWRLFLVFSWSALLLVGLSIFGNNSNPIWAGWLVITPFSLVLAVLVQLLGTVIAAFSARYLKGEANQQRYVAALAAVLSAVHLLLMADHWLVLIAAWAIVGAALQHLLCFYPDRPFALLAAHKKFIADRLADVLLLGAAALAWSEVGSGSLSALWQYIAQNELSLRLELSAMGLVLAVILRTALLPVHGWLIQVMEAPTPVSALLHAGVVNLGGFVLIRFAPLLEHSDIARGVLLAFGLTTAVLAGMVMLTRISIKVRLAWSTVAQMGFMLVECALGLYTLATLHLIGHSLYKAHAFLSSSTVVRQTRLQNLRSASQPSTISLSLAPVITVSLVLLLMSVPANAMWPWWWSLVLGLAWAPLLWLPTAPEFKSAHTKQIMFGLFAVSALTFVVMAGHTVPLGIEDTPHDKFGLIALACMAALYLCQVALIKSPEQLSRWRRWSYAGFYLDEAYTRLTLRFWPSNWTTQAVEQKNTGATK